MYCSPSIMVSSRSTLSSFEEKHFSKYIIYWKNFSYIWRTDADADAVHLVRNIRNNLLSYKWCIFPSFKFYGFKDPINVSVGEIKLNFFLVTVREIGYYSIRFTTLHSGRVCFMSFFIKELSAIYMQHTWVNWTTFL